MSIENRTFVHIVPMTKAEYQGKERPLTISYSMVNFSSGSYMIASTGKGICLIMPAEMKWSPVETLKKQFPKARFRCQKVAFHKEAAQLLKRRPGKVRDLPLHLYGTPFQLAVWEDLLHIEQGDITTYGEVARRVGKPHAARPVGRAVGSNPVMRIIPCHRVICTNGKMGGYRWGVERKIKLLNQEACATKKKTGFSKWEPTMF